MQRSLYAKRSSGTSELPLWSSNLDEIFMVRAAGLLQQMESGVQDLSIVRIPRLFLFIAARDSWRGDTPV